VNAYAKPDSPYASPKNPYAQEDTTVEETTTPATTYYTTKVDGTTIGATTSATTAPFNGYNAEFGSNVNQGLNDNAAIEAFNYAKNVDEDGDGIADSQFSGLKCWNCHATNFYDCSQMGAAVECRNNQVLK
jgi:hypothetical protein